MDIIEEENEYKPIKNDKRGKVTKYVIWNMLIPITLLSSFVIFYYLSLEGCPVVPFDVNL